MSNHRVAILQSNYLPWKGYFDIIRCVDTFVFYDEVQYTKNDWRNRNQIKTPHGVKWITVPAGASISRRVCDVDVIDQSWKRKHRDAIEMNYSRAPFYSQFSFILDAIFANELSNLSAFNQAAISEIATAFGVSTKLLDSQGLGAPGGQTQRLINILEACDATEYVSGPSARSYLDEGLFKKAGIELKYVDYSGYEEYPQLHPPFTHNVTSLDLLFNVGGASPMFLKNL